MIRICPNCKVKLGGYDHFFCTNCGNPLPSSLINKDAPVSQVADFSATQNKKFALGPYLKEALSKVDKSKIAIFAFVLLFLVSGALFLVPKIKQLVISRSEEAKKSQLIQRKFTKNNIKVPVEWATGKTAQNNLLESVPFEAQIVVEMFDPSKFSELFVRSDPAYSEIASALESSTSSDVVFFAQKIENKYVWTLLTKPSEQKIKIPQNLIDKYPWLKFSSDEQELVISTDNIALTRAIESRNKVARNFTQTPLFSSAKATLPTEGKMYVFFSSDLAREQFKQIKIDAQKNPELDMIVKTIINSKSDYLIIE